MYMMYAVVGEDVRIEWKETEGDFYQTLKKELDDAIFDVLSVGELDIWFGEEFLLRNDIPDPTLLIKLVDSPKVENEDIVICGKVVFASSNEEGDAISLTPGAIDILKKFFQAKVGGYRLLCFESFREIA